MQIISVDDFSSLEERMKKTLLVSAILFAGLSAFAGNKQVIGVATICDCYERTIDGETYLGKVGNRTPARTERAARISAKNECNRLDRDDQFTPHIQNCVYSKAIQERVGRHVRSRIERLSGDAENSMANDLLSTL
jgi:hypothetical protein